MEFKIEIPKTKVIVQESIPIKFCLVNGKTPVDIPLEYESSDVVTLVLLNDQEELVAQADGYTKLMRLETHVRRVSQTDMKTERLDSGQMMEWEEDLLAYMDIDLPGRYFVYAKFQFQPSNISLESQRVPIEVGRNNCNWFDVLHDQVSMAMVYFVQQHNAPGETKTLFQISNGFEITKFWTGGVMGLPAGSRPRVSEADFATQETFEHDFFRWLSWIENGKLRAVSFTESSPSETIYEYSLEQEGVTMIGRPIQHIDHGVSVLVLKRERERYKIIQLDFDSAFKNRGRSVLASFDFLPAPLSTVSDWQGRIYIVTGENKALPVHLIEVDSGRIVKDTVVLSESILPEFVGQKSLQILSVFPDVKIYSALVKAILITALLEDERGSSLKLIRIPLDADGEESKKIQMIDVPIDGGLLNEDEDVVAAEMVQTQKAELHAIFLTSAGNIFYIRQGERPQKVIQISRDLSNLSRLIISARGDIYLFFPVEGKGIGHRLLYRKVRR